MKTEVLEEAETANSTVTNHRTIPSPASLFRLKNILVPVDFTELSLKSLQYAVPFARQFAAKITLLHVAAASDHHLDFSFPVPLEEKRLAELARQLDDFRVARIPQGVPVETMVRQSPVFDAILEVARATQADLIVTTTHGYTGLDRLLLGSTSEAVTRRATCPVLIVHEHERDFI